jgi:hypothetical protein
LVYTSRMSGSFAILNPWLKKWADLEGNGRARFCSECQKHVHAMDQYSASERNALWREPGGKICALLRTAPVPLPTRRAMLIGGLLTAVAPLFAANGQARFLVVYIEGEVLPKTTISLIDKENHTLRSLETNASGEAVWTDLPLGNSRFLVECRPFQSKTLTITIKNAKENKIEVQLYIPPIGTTIETKRKLKPVKRNGWLIY